MSTPARRTRHGLLPALALLAVLAAIAGTIALRAVRRSTGSPAAATPAPLRPAPAAPGHATPAGGLDRGALARALGPPEDDLPPARFSERVDGADAALRRAGCVALLGWRREEPVPHDLELYVFHEPAEARVFLAGRGAPPGKDRVTADGEFLARVGRCAVIALPDDPDAAPRLADLLGPVLARDLPAAGCGTGDRR